ncbi:MAG: tRNA pseudouridine(55) synthase TruB [Clostridia bacterium]
MYNGIIIIDKPQEFTSHDVIAKLRGMLKMRKMGHSGTLDPMATGILPIFLGNATRASDFHGATEKEYVATFKLGIETTTEDIWGEIINTQPVDINVESVCKVVESFHGKIMQTPPMYSAVKIKGQRLYDIARNGGTVERPAREIEIFEIEMLADDTLEQNEYAIRVLCSKGTYVRTICADIGKKLGNIATLTSLRRTKSGGYFKGFTLDEIQELAYNDDIESILMPTDSVFSGYHKMSVNEQGFTRLKNGTFARDTDCENFPENFETDVAVYYDDVFFMLAKSSPLYDGGRAIFPVKSFF